MPRDGGPVVAVLAPMASELRPVVRAAGLRRAPAIEPAGAGGSAAAHEPFVAYEGDVGATHVVAMRTGIGTAISTAATHAVLDHHDVVHVVVVGIAGAVGPSHPLGDRIAPARVIDGRSGEAYEPHPFGAAGPAPSGSLLTGDELIRDRTRLAELERGGVVALDMETAAVAAVCEARQVPWSVSRAISDLADDDAIDDEVGALSHPDGTPDLAAVGRYLLRGPWRARHLVRLGRQMQVAAQVAAEAAVAGIRQRD